jgi:hypothetical protein
MGRSLKAQIMALEEQVGGAAAAAAAAAEAIPNMTHACTPLRFVTLCALHLMCQTPHYVSNSPKRTVAGETYWRKEGIQL